MSSISPDNKHEVASAISHGDSTTSGSELSSIASQVAEDALTSGATAEYTGALTGKRRRDQEASRVALLSAKTARTREEDHSVGAVRSAATGAGEEEVSASSVSLSKTQQLKKLGLPMQNLEDWLDEMHEGEQLLLESPQFQFYQDSVGRLYDKHEDSISGLFHSVLGYGCHKDILQNSLSKFECAVLAYLVGSAALINDFWEEDKVTKEDIVALTIQTDIGHEDLMIETALFALNKLKNIAFPELYQDVVITVEKDEVEVSTLYVPKFVPGTEWLIDDAEKVGLGLYTMFSGLLLSRVSSKNKPRVFEAVTAQMISTKIDKESLLHALLLFGSGNTVEEGREYTLQNMLEDQPDEATENIADMLKSLSEAVSTTDDKVIVHNLYKQVVTLMLSSQYVHIKTIFDTLYQDFSGAETPQLQAIMAFYWAICNIIENSGCPENFKKLHEVCAIKLSDSADKATVKEFIAKAKLAVAQSKRKLRHISYLEKALEGLK